MTDQTIKSAHFIGIGGIGMSGIARLFLSNGIKVSGSDLKKSSITQELENLGATIFIGHDTRNVPSQADSVVYSSAVKEDNPELKEAIKKGLRVMKRAEALAELMKGKTAITVTGSHGKTTTASLVSYLLIEAGLLPTVVIGGILRNIDKNAFQGSGELFVAEADESDGSFLYYNPKYSIITNIDREHLDYYRDFDNEISAFREFMARTDKSGCLFCCSEDYNLRKLLEGYSGQYMLFGLDDSAHIYAKNIELKGLTSEFDCYYNGKLLDRFYLSLAGKHNIRNALSAIALGLKLNIDIDFIKKALKDYKGAGRRMEVKLKNDSLMVIDDYAHHPTEIKATLAALKNLKAKRIVAVFQPHRYTRTQLLLDDFAKSFNDADYCIITDIYAASEKEIRGVTAESLINKLKNNDAKKEVELVHKERVSSRILEILEPGDLVVTLGAGDITKVSDELVEQIKRQSKI